MAKKVETKKPGKPAPPPKKPAPPPKKPAAVGSYAGFREEDDDEDDDIPVNYEVSLHTIRIEQTGVDPCPPARTGRQLTVRGTVNPSGNMPVNVTLTLLDGGGTPIVTFGPTAATVTGASWVITFATPIDPNARRGKIKVTTLFDMLLTTAHLSFSINP